MARPSGCAAAVPFGPRGSSSRMLLATTALLVILAGASCMEQPRVPSTEPMREQLPHKDRDGDLHTWRSEVSDVVASLAVRDVFCKLEPERQCTVPPHLALGDLKTWAATDPGWERMVASLSLYELGRRLWQEQAYERSVLNVERSLAYKLFPYTDRSRNLLWLRALASPAGSFERPKLELADALVLAAACMHQVGKRSFEAGDPSYLYTAYKAAHLGATLMQLTSDPKPEVTDHLEALCGEVMTEMSASLARRATPSLERYCQDWGGKESTVPMPKCSSNPDGCKESDRRQVLLALIARGRLPLRLPDGGLQTLMLTKPHMQESMVLRPLEGATDTTEFVERLFRQLMGVLRLTVLRDLGVECRQWGGCSTMPGLQTLDAASHPSSHVNLIRDEGEELGVVLQVGPSNHATVLGWSTLYNGQEAEQCGGGDNVAKNIVATAETVARVLAAGNIADEIAALALPHDGTLEGGNPTDDDPMVVITTGATGSADRQYRLKASDLLESFHTPNVTRDISHILAVVHMVGFTPQRSLALAARPAERPSAARAQPLPENQVGYVPVAPPFPPPPLVFGTKGKALGKLQALPFKPPHPGPGRSPSFRRRVDVLQQFNFLALHAKKVFRHNDGLATCGGPSRACRPGDSTRAVARFYAAIFQGLRPRTPAVQSVIVGGTAHEREVVEARDKAEELAKRQSRHARAAGWGGSSKEGGAGWGGGGGASDAPRLLVAGAVAALLGSTALAAALVCRQRSSPTHPALTFLLRCLPRALVGSNASHHSGAPRAARGIGHHHPDALAPAVGRRALGAHARRAASASSGPTAHRPPPAAPPASAAALAAAALATAASVAAVFLAACASRAASACARAATRSLVTTLARWRWLPAHGSAGARARQQHSNKGGSGGGGSSGCGGVSFQQGGGGRGARGASGAQCVDVLPGRAHDDDARMHASYSSSSCSSSAGSSASVAGGSGHAARHAMDDAAKRAARSGGGGDSSSRGGHGQQAAAPPDADSPRQPKHAPAAAPTAAAAPAGPPDPPSRTSSKRAAAAAQRSTAAAMGAHERESYPREARAMPAPPVLQTSGPSPSPSGMLAASLSQPTPPSAAAAKAVNPQPGKQQATGQAQQQQQQQQAKQQATGQAQQQQQQQAKQQQQPAAKVTVTTVAAATPAPHKQDQQQQQRAALAPVPASKTTTPLQQQQQQQAPLRQAAAASQQQALDSSLLKKTAPIKTKKAPVPAPTATQPPPPPQPPSSNGGSARAQGAQGGPLARGGSMPHQTQQQQQAQAQAQAQALQPGSKSWAGGSSDIPGSGGGAASAQQQQQQHAPPRTWGVPNASGVGGGSAPATSGSPSQPSLSSISYSPTNSSRHSPGGAAAAAGAKATTATQQAQFRPPPPPPPPRAPAQAAAGQSPQQQQQPPQQQPPQQQQQQRTAPVSPQTFQQQLAALTQATAHTQAQQSQTQQGQQSTQALTPPGGGVLSMQQQQHFIEGQQAGSRPGVVIRGGTSSGGGGGSAWGGPEEPGPFGSPSAARLAAAATGRGGDGGVHAPHQPSSSLRTQHLPAHSLSPSDSPPYSHASIDPYGDSYSHAALATHGGQAPYPDYSGLGGVGSEWSSGLGNGAGVGFGSFHRSAEFSDTLGIIGGAGGGGGGGGGHTHIGGGGGAYGGEHSPSPRTTMLGASAAGDALRGDSLSGDSFTRAQQQQQLSGAAANNSGSGGGEQYGHHMGSSIGFGGGLVGGSSVGSGSSTLSQQQQQQQHLSHGTAKNAAMPGVPNSTAAPSTAVPAALPLFSGSSLWSASPAELALAAPSTSGNVNAQQSGQHSYMFDLWGGIKSSVFGGSSSAGAGAGGVTDTDTVAFQTACAVAAQWGGVGVGAGGGACVGVGGAGGLSLSPSASQSQRIAQAAAAVLQERQALAVAAVQAAQQAQASHAQAQQQAAQHQQQQLQARQQRVQGSLLSAHAQPHTLPGLPHLPDEAELHHPHTTHSHATHSSMLLPANSAAAAPSQQQQQQPSPRNRLHDSHNHSQRQSSAAGVNSGGAHHHTASTGAVPIRNTAHAGNKPAVRGGGSLGAGGVHGGGGGGGGGVSGLAASRGLASVPSETDLLSLSGGAIRNDLLMGMGMSSDLERRRSGVSSDFEGRRSGEGLDWAHEINRLVE
ncbi:hypothetical protein FOA52_002697 [Chlamydomonas sp. UWO 241]|nr:hypothetical protein FOA52_002697 [Chlamydomonas sp. UWO 241]